ncbi:hypothetical protein SAMN06298210_10198 [Prevotellaceae bacterium KH2P17]|nr:hypothetical protein SAMN06298210_10198 [Prevotellaceae bacterium KH2P17]
MFFFDFYLQELAVNSTLLTLTVIRGGAWEDGSHCAVTG